MRSLPLLLLTAPLLLATSLRGADAPRVPHRDASGISDPSLPAPAADTALMTPEDHAIAGAVVRQLAAGPGVPARQIQVDVTQGVVALSGQVLTLAQREHAADLAVLVPGVRAVLDHLSLVPRTVTLMDLQQHCAQALASDAALQDLPLRAVVAEDGTATLSGAVRSPADRTLALATVMRQPGVTAVIDGMTVGPLLPPRGHLLLTAVSEALGENVLLAQDPIQVRVRDDGQSVSLSGRVAGPLARQVAIGLAQAAGADRVEEHLVVIGTPTLRSRWPGDAEIRSAVDAVLRREPALAALHPNIAVTEGALVLSGNLASPQAAALLDDLRHVAGVARVVDAVIGGGVESPMDREALTRLVADLARDPSLRARPVLIGFDAGTMRLAGRVASLGEREWAIARCRQDKDVGAVEDDLVIDPQVAAHAFAPGLLPSPAESLAQVDRLWLGAIGQRSDAQVARQVQASLHGLGVPAGAVQVHCAHGVVVLEGEVGNALERTLAQTGAVLAEPLAVENNVHVTGSARAG